MGGLRDGGDDRMMHRGHPLLLAGLTFLCLALLVAAGPTRSFADATPPVNLCSGEGPAAGECGIAYGVAVDQSTGDVYMADSTNRRIDQFDADGNFVRAFGSGVVSGDDPTTAGPDVCTTLTGCQQGFAEPTPGAGQIWQPRGIAVDPATHFVYVVSSGASLSYFDGTTGAFVGQFNGIEGVDPPAPEKLGSVTGVAVDASAATHYLYVASAVRIDKFTVAGPGGTPQPGYVCQITGTAAATSANSTECGGNGLPSHKDGVFEGLDARGGGEANGANLAVDPSGNVFFAESPTSRGVVSEFDAEGDFVRQITPTLPRPEAVTTLPDGHLLLVVDGTYPGGGGRVVQEYDPSSPRSPLEEFGPSTILAIRGVAATTEGPNRILYAGGGTYYPDGIPGGAVWKISAGPRVAPTAPTVEAQASSEVTGTSARLEATINPNHGSVAATSENFPGAKDCEFRYGTDPSLAIYQSLPCENPSSLGAGESGVLTSSVAGAGGHPLTPEAIYFWRVYAANSAGSDEGKIESFTTFIPTAPPSVFPGQAPAYGDGSATVSAEVNPNGLATSYHVEYVNDATFQADQPNGFEHARSTAEVGGIDGDRQLHGVDAELTGLRLGTRYHYRFVAGNAVGIGTGGGEFVQQSRCPNEEIRIERHLTYLGECRAYELVTPFSSVTGQVGTQGVLVAGDGSALFSGKTPFGGEPAGVLNSYVGTREDEGWLDTVVSPPNPHREDVFTGTAFGATPDLSEIVVSANAALDPGDVNNRTDVYMRKPDGSFEWISRGSRQVDQAESAPAEYVGMSADGRRVFFRAAEQLEPAATGLASGEVLYERDRDSGVTRVVDVDDGGQLIGKEGAVFGGAPLHPNTGLQITAQNAISRDGLRQFFSSPTPKESDGTESDDTEPVGLYLREGGKTIKVSKPQGVDSAAEDANYEGAAADGSRVFFSTAQQLTQDDTNDGEDLYEYDVETGHLKRVTAGESGDAEGDLQAVVAISADGSHVYFIARGVLAGNQAAATAPGQPAEAQAGNNNLYVYDTGTGTTRYIAKLNGVIGGSRLITRRAEATPSGRFLAFSSATPLVGEDLDGAMDVYRYDAASASLSLLSVGEEGRGRQGSFDSTLSVPGAPGEELSYAISDDGTRAFFETEEALVSTDRNEANDVYEWHNGQVALLSCGCGVEADGTANNAAAVFAGANPEGTDVMLITRNALVSGDRDDGDYDLYDARVDGGFAEQTPAPLPNCEGEACRPAEEVSPEPAAIGSTAGGGAGNLNPARPTKPRCKHGKRLVKRAGKARCVKPKQVKKHRKKHVSGKKKHKAKHGQKKRGGAGRPAAGKGR